MQDKISILHLEKENISKKRVHEIGLLLLQFSLDNQTEDDGKAVQLAPVALEQLKTPFLGELEYGQKGKPYLRGKCCYFNISHSGEYVVCALSEQEVGVDIQEHKELDFMATAKRFFSEEEVCVLERTLPQKRSELFYRLWTRKEAYGKMIGEGIVPVLHKNMLELSNGTIEMEDFIQISGYSLALCKAVKE